MIKAAGIRFYLQDKIYNFALNDLELKSGDVVIAETELGQEAGEVIVPSQEIDEKRLEKSLKPILRKLNAGDLEKIKKYSQKKPEALEFCHQAIKKYNLSMKLQDVSFAFDGSRITFYFTSETRVDFRDLVKDLTRRFQKSIRLQQVGSRDVARHFGGYGICGRELCCASFLKEFKSITLDLAKEQQMVQRGSGRISGNCGRLLCCLSYENDSYKELNKNMPEVGTTVKTGKGVGKVLGKNILKQTVDIALDEETRITLPMSEVKQIK
jgi:cell fate regulator YaaT (PSP1 superfamily)